jgi:hypothetical protein
MQHELAQDLRSVPAVSSPDSVLDWARLHSTLQEDKRRFRADPQAPHVVLDGFLDEAWLSESNLPEELRQLALSGTLDEFRYFNTRSSATTGFEQLPPAGRQIIEALHSPPFLAYLSELTGIPNLVADVELANGGVHFMGPGGYVALHRDEYIHPYRSQLRRRLNLLVYLNPGWQEQYGGHLELWSNDGQRQLHKILPVLNRCVVTAIEENVHGVPGPIACPPDDFRKTLILWFYTDEGRPVKFEPAVFVNRPDDALPRKIAVQLESKVFGLYQRVKRALQSDNRIALRLMKLTGYHRISKS